jgi:hypothetical protein
VSPDVAARLAGAVYVVTFATGIYALVTRSTAAALAAAASYVVVTILFYYLFKPVSRPLSLAAAAISFAGILIGPLRVSTVNPLVFFGVYCLLIGYLVSTSTFLPRAVGVLMALSSVGWLTYASPALGQSLYPYNLVPGIVGEGALTLWLLVFGVDAPRWEQMRTPTARLRG